MSETEAGAADGRAGEGAITGAPSAEEEVVSTLRQYHHRSDYGEVYHGFLFQKFMGGVEIDRQIFDDEAEGIFYKNVVGNHITKRDKFMLAGMREHEKGDYKTAATFAMKAMDEKQVTKIRKLFNELGCEEKRITEALNTGREKVNRDFDAWTKEIIGD